MIRIAGHIAPQRRSRRQVLREQLTADINTAARELLAEHGLPGLTLAAVAGRVGVSTPALYRYVESRDDLIGQLCLELVRDLNHYLKHQVPPAETSVAERLRQGCLALRTWAIEHRSEFMLLYSAPPETLGPKSAQITQERMIATGEVFGELFTEAWRDRPQPDTLLPEALHQQMAAYREATGIEIPLQALAFFLECFYALYGAITAELVGFLSPSIDDHELLYHRLVDRLIERTLTVDG